MVTQTKYIQIRHWNYWHGVYQLLAPNEPGGAEFSLTNDVAGEELFFHFDLFNLSTLQYLMDENEYIEQDSPQYPAFIRKVEALKKRELDCFVGALHYEHFYPDLEFCNQPLTTEKIIFDLKSPIAMPYYADIFLAEDRPLVPDVVKSWVERLSDRLFGQHICCEFADVPTKAQTEENYRKEVAYSTFYDG